MGRGQRFRRVVMWAAGVVLVLSVASWAASLWGVGWNKPNPQWQAKPQTLNFRLEWGLAIVSNEFLGRRDGWFVTRFDWPRNWWPKNRVFYYVHARNAPPQWGIYIPIWIPTALSGLCLCGTLLIGRHRRALAHNALCPTCGYDLTGIDGVCPECGGKR